MNSIVKQILDAEKEFEETFCENVTFSNISLLKEDEFSDTLAFVKGLSETWDNLPDISLKPKNTQQQSQRTDTSWNDTKCSIKNEVIDDPLSMNTDLKYWNLPEDIIEKYNNKGILQMFPWQAECLSNADVLHNNKNLIYSAPTSAGKTLVAEILLLKAVIERQKKALIILPFVSVVREKTYYFQEILSSSGIRVEGFMGVHSPPGGYQAVHVAICTIEKANSLINHMLEDGNIANLGLVIVDELHLLGDPHRGYILELLLTKILYMSKKNSDAQIQIVGMSATLPNLSTLSDWLDAELYKTDFRPIPLQENCLIGDEIQNSNFECISKILSNDVLQNDTDHIIYLALETIFDNCSVLIFCPTKSWCESLAQRISTKFKQIGYGTSQYSQYLREQLNPALIKEVIQLLHLSPVGLDPVLHETICFGVGFHHAGLTMDERDIIESAFKRGAIRVLVATSTLSSGVNLPARRVIIRSTHFYSKPINIMTYKQMIGRAGRMGIDSVGESILIGNDRKTADKLLNGKFEPITSCLEGEDKLMRAILESIASEIASNYEDILLYTQSTLLFHSSVSRINAKKLADDNLNELKNYELIRICEDIYSATALGKACLSSSMSPQDGLTLFKELQKARECFVLETDLHMIYLVTPYSICQQWGDINWVHFLKMWDNLSNSMKRVGKLVGVNEGSIYRFMNKYNCTNDNFTQKKIQLYKRFYTALALQDLINEIPLSKVADKFSCSRGMLQSLQQSAATFAGMVTAFSRKLGWKSFELLVSQFQDRLHFGIQFELIELMKLQSLNSTRARALYDSGIKSLNQLAFANVFNVAKALYTAIPFESEKKRDGDLNYDVIKRNEEKNIWLTGKKGVSVNEAANIIIEEAQTYLKLEMGIKEIDWKHRDEVKITKCNENSLINQNITPTTEQTLWVYETENDQQDDIEINENLLVIKSEIIDSDINEKDDNIFEDSLIVDTQLNGILNNNAKSSTANIFPDENKVGPSKNSSYEIILGSQNISTRKCYVDLSINNAFDDSFTFNKENQSVIKRKGTDLNVSDDIFVSPVKLPKESSVESNDNSDCDSFALEFSKCLLFKDRDYKSVALPDILKKQVDKLYYEHFNFVRSCDNKNIFDKTMSHLENCDTYSLFVNVVLVDSQPKTVIGGSIAGNNHNTQISKNCFFNGKYISGLAIYVPASEPFLFYFDLQKYNEIKITEIMSSLSKLLNDQNKTVILHNAKYTLKTLAECCKINILPTCQDPEVLEWVLNPEYEKVFTHVELQKYFRADMSSFQNYFSEKLKWNISEYIPCIFAWANYFIMKKLKKIMNQKHFGGLQIFKKEMKFLSILAQYEVPGIFVNRKKAICMTKKIKRLQNILEQQAYGLAGETFQLSSPAAVAKVLGLYNGSKTKTDKKTLQKIENPLAQMVIYWRKLHNVLTRILYPVIRVTAEPPNFLYPNYSTFTLTGRVNMAEPSIQFVPRNFEIPLELMFLDDSVQTRLTVNKQEIKCRDIITAQKGRILISADYRQLELRLLAHFSQDDTLLKVLRGNGDVFKAIAAKWKNIPEDEINDELRHDVKQLCYGIIYGMGKKTLSELLDIPVPEAYKFINTFYSAYPKIKPFIESVETYCEDNGYVETLDKRRRYLPLIYSNMEHEKAQAKRQAVNTMIQGTAADILKSSLISVHERIERDFRDVDIKLVLLLHDELIFEIPEEKVNDFSNLLIACMTDNQKLLVPLPVQIKYGTEWGDLKLI